MAQQYPAGWYSQADGSQRYWDGGQWTNQVIPPGQQPMVSHDPLLADGQGEMAVKTPWYQKKRVLIPAGLVIAAVGYAALQGGGEGQTAAPLASPSVSVAASASASDAIEPSVEPLPVAPETSTAPAASAPETEPAEEPEVDSGASVSQTQAVRQAESYLEFAAFSRSGLIKQLEFEGFSNADATFAVDAIQVDWMAQAISKADDYLSYSAFSRTGLIEQLEFEGFTSEQATHGVDSVEVDWMDQAALKAKDYLEYSAFSRSSLIDQLEFEGFTAEQAAHGADAAGL
ncbi:Ltp family lipoprotein [Tessaracoccus sp. MC1627]|uniref:Ltp family lipoprotein n=1 Tax=Tessaracoccus sp. MC1627 TaxID=2760312 RepID=UPI00160394E1|nr:Ltp family lipoprotein [Tessaracoccus sp. MC1627]MBB1514046.1 Ltp family lipoprotein [Tessaracoccus sp. MC1627]